MFNLVDLSDEENNLVKKAKVEYGDYFLNVNDVISYYWEFIDKIRPKAYMLFMSFFSQVTSSLHLATLSAVRKHDVQTMMVLRNVLESGVLAAYSLSNHNENDFMIIDADGNCDINNKIKNQAYDWLDSNYNKYSTTIKFLKTEYINQFSAHSNILNAFSTADFSQDRKVMVSYFDGNGEDSEHFIIMTKQRLWLIANIALGLLQLLKDVSVTYPFIITREDFNYKLQKMWNDNNNLKEQLINNPRFSKWIK